MTQCASCGEPNHHDARYCASCGRAIAAPSGIEALVADAPPPDDPASGASPTATRPPAAASAEVGATPTAVYPTAEPVGPANDSRRASVKSAGVMIAALAVAAIVIIGGVLVLLAGSSGGGETARTGDDASAPVDTPATDGSTSLPATVVPSTSLPAVTAPEPESVVLETVAPVTAASTSTSTSTSTTSAPVVTLVVITVPTTLPATVPTTVPTTVAPTVPTTAAPAPTTPDPTTAPNRGDGDLGLDQPILDEDCDGRYITFVGSAVGNRPYRTAVAELLDRYPGTEYIWTKSCPSLRQEFTDGADIYGVVFGPFASRQDACAARSSGPADAYVRRISTTDSADHTVEC